MYSFVAPVGTHQIIAVDVVPNSLTDVVLNGRNAHVVIGSRNY